MIISVFLLNMIMIPLMPEMLAESSTTGDASKIPNSQTNSIKTSSKVIVTLGGGDAEKAKQVVESFVNVGSATLNNLENGRFKLDISVYGDSEIRPLLVKTFVQNGYDLFEMLTVDKTPPKIGDIGPGGGIVFCIEGEKAYECSDILGRYEWNAAQTVCKDYRGGGKSDWYLPNLVQLNQIYKNLRKTKIISDSDYLWSSTPHSDSELAMIMNFSDGGQWTNYTYIPNYIRAVRVFEY